MNTTWLIAVASVLGSVLVTLVTGFMARPRQVTDINVALSGDARAWAQVFADRADAAERKADDAETRAAAAEARINRLERHILVLEREVRRLGGNIPPLPNGTA